MATTTTAVRPRRRKLRFNSFDEVLAEVDSLQVRPHQQAGNWSLPMIAGHLARAIEFSTTGDTFPVPWYFKVIGPWVKKRALEKGLISGFKLPAVIRPRLIPEAQTDCGEEIAHLRRSIERLSSNPPRGGHPVFGPLTVDEWNKFHLRHAELHLSFLVPE